MNTLFFCLFSEAHQNFKNVIPFGTATDVPWMSVVMLAMKTCWNALSNAKASQARYPTHHLL